MSNFLLVELYLVLYKTWNTWNHSVLQPMVSDGTWRQLWYVSVTTLHIRNSFKCGIKDVLSSLNALTSIYFWSRFVSINVYVLWTHLYVKNCWYNNIRWNFFSEFFSYWINPILFFILQLSSQVQKLKLLTGEMSL